MVLLTMGFIPGMNTLRAFDNPHTSGWERALAVGTDLLMVAGPVVATVATVAKAGLLAEEAAAVVEAAEAVAAQTAAGTEAASSASRVAMLGRELAPTFGNLGDIAEGSLAGILEEANGVYHLGGSPASGTFDFVVIDRQIRIGTGHPFLAGGQRVTWAGEISLENGQVVRWSNVSGHYRPAAGFFRNAPLPAAAFKAPSYWPVSAGLPQLPVFQP